MNIGFRTAGFYQWPLTKALETLSALGYSGVELCLEHPDCRPETLTVAEAERIALHCKDLGLEVASVSYHADYEEPNVRADNTLRAGRLVRALGSDLLIINGRRVRQNNQDELRNELIDLVARLLPQARQAGFKVAVEPEPGLAIGSSADMAALLTQIASPYLAVNLDVGHAFLTDADVCESIRQLAPAIAHTHVEGMAAGVHRHLLPGEGDLDLVAVCRVLREIGYTGYYTVDLFSIEDDPKSWAKQGLEAMREILALARATE